MEAPQEVARPTTRVSSTKPAARRRSDLTGLIFLLPFLIAYALFLIWPIILGFRMSLFNWSLVSGGASEFLGLENYRELFGDPVFWSSMWHTVLFTLLSTPPLVLIALVLAMLVNRVTFAQWFFRFSFFAPFVLPVSVVALIWIWLFQPGYGLINSYLTSLGLGEVGWLTDENVAMITVVIVTVWWTVGFNFVLYLAGLQEIPRDLYDASAVDGAGALAQTRWVTIPMLSRTTVLVVVLQILASLKVFDQIYVMYTQGGLNYPVTRPIVGYVYDQGFTSYRVGYGSAMSYVFFVIILAMSVIWFAVARRREGNA
jgi:multiple sugar transport system permease protein